MKCSRCSAENPADTRFCRTCATPLQKPEGPTLIRCSLCKAENPPNARFCGNCAATLQASEEPTITLNTPVNEIIIGNKFAERYHIIEELGRGGMGTVYKALDTEVNEKIAIKLLNPEISNDERTIVRFRNELKLARKVSHQYVCRMYELMKKNGTYFITMQYVSGEDLRSTINRVGQLSAKKTLEYARQICEGLGMAHRLGVVHRDLKPHNIMIDMDGKVRIMDFGIARSLKSTGLTDSGVMIGTPQYMSPEQASEGEVDQRSDIYSLGIILFELLTGTIPFRGDTSVGVALKHCTDLPPNPKSLNPGIPEELNQLILKCLEKKRDRRPQTVEEILSEITKIEDSISEKKTSSFPLWNWIKRNFKFSIPGTLILAAMALFILYPILQPKLEITINTNPTGALVYLGKKQMGKSPATKRISPGFYTLKITKEGYETIGEEIELKSDFNNTYSLIESKKLVLLEITSTPENAEIYLEGKIMGTTPFIRELPAGTYDMTIKLAHFQEKTVDLDINNIQKYEENFVLDPLYFIKVTTTPSGAIVRIDNDFKGTTDTKNLELDKDSCVLQLSKKGYAAQTHRVDLKHGEINNFHYSLIRETSPQLFTMSINTEPPGANVFVNGESLGFSPQKKQYQSGTYKIKLEKEGYETKEIEIALNSDIDNTYPLAKLAKAKVVFKVAPWARVYVDGKEIGQDPSLEYELDAGQHNFEFRNPGFKNISFPAEIKSGEHLLIKVWMQSRKHTIEKLGDIK